MAILQRPETNEADDTVSNDQARVEANDENQVGDDTEDQNASPTACKTCYTEQQLTHGIFLSCGCLYCTDCLNAAFRVALDNRVNFPPRCCTMNIEFATFASYLTDDNVTRYLAADEDLGARAPIHCGNCSKYLADLQGGGEHGRMVNCPVCDVATCVDCRELANAHSIEDDDLACPDSLALAGFKDVANGGGWRRCPGCKRVVEKSAACDHMTLVFSCALAFPQLKCLQMPVRNGISLSLWSSVWRWIEMRLLRG